MTCGNSVLGIISLTSVLNVQSTFYTRRVANFFKKKISYEMDTYTVVLRLKINQYDNIMSCVKCLHVVMNRRVDCMTVKTKFLLNI